MLLSLSYKNKDTCKTCFPKSFIWVQSQNEQKTINVTNQIELWIIKYQLSYIQKIFIPYISYISMIKSIRDQNSCNFFAKNHSRDKLNQLILKARLAWWLWTQDMCLWSPWKRLISLVLLRYISCRNNDRLFHPRHIFHP